MASLPQAEEVLPAAGGRSWMWPLMACVALGTAYLVGSAGGREPAALKRAPSATVRLGDGVRIGAAAELERPSPSETGIVRRLYQRIEDNRLPAVAAGAVFYGLLALFPALAALVAIYGAFADAATINANLSALSGILPDGAIAILHEALARLIAKGTSRLSLGFAIGLIIALWSANSGTKAIFDALNAAYGKKEERGFFVLNLISLAFTLAGLVFIMLALSAVVVAPIVFGLVGFPGGSDALIGALRWPAIFFVVVFGLEALYRFGPSRSGARWRWASAGSITAAAVWLASSALFSWYIANLARYDATYGSLGAAVGMMMWMWLSMIVILIGAELNAELNAELGGEVRDRR